MNAKHRTTLILALITSLVIFGCGFGQVAPTSIPVSTPTTTTTPLPANTAMPTATPAPSIVGTLVEATLVTPPEKTQIARPSLANEVVILCLKTQNTCTIDKSLSVKTDENGSFVFDSVPAGEYVILYAAFLSQQEDKKITEDFWTYWDGKVLDFSDLDAFAASFVDPSSTAMGPQFISDRGYGILPALSQQVGGTSNTGVCYMAKFMAVEFIGDMEPLTVTVIPGQTAQVTVEAHAGLVIVLF